MLLFVTILLSICLIASSIFNILLYKAGVRQIEASEILQEDIEILREWIVQFKADTLKTYAHMKLLDDKEMFSKDDEVGTTFQNMVQLIKSLNERTQESEES